MCNLKIMNNTRKSIIMVFLLLILGVTFFPMNGLAFIIKPPPGGSSKPAPPHLNYPPSPDYDGKITLSWSSSALATGYKLFRSTSYSGGYQPIATTAQLSYTDQVPTSGYWYYLVKAYNNAGDSLSSNIVSVEVPEPPSDPTPLFGSTQRFFPHEETSRLGFTIFSLGTISIPTISLSITETETFNENVHIRIFIDGMEIYHVSRNFITNIPIEFYTGAYNLRYEGTHQIVVELSNAAGSYYLNHIQIQHLEFSYSILHEGNRYSPAQIWQYDSQYDNIVVTFGDDVPFLNDDFRTDDIQTIEFWPSITIRMDPDKEFNSDLYAWEYFIHKYMIEWKVIDQEGNCLTSSSVEFNKLNSYGCQIGVSDGNQDEKYEAIEFLLKCLETAFIIGAAIYELSPYIEIPISLALAWLEFDYDPPRSDQDFIDDNTYQVSWRTGYEGSGGWVWPSPKKRSASMLAEWDFESYSTGQYQIQYHWTLITRKFRSWKVLPYAQEVLTGFTLEGDYFVNFEFY